MSGCLKKTTYVASGITYESVWYISTLECLYAYLLISRHSEIYILSLDVPKVEPLGQKRVSGYWFPDVYMPILLPKHILGSWNYSPWRVITHSCPRYVYGQISTCVCFLSFSMKWMKNMGQYKCVCVCIYIYMSWHIEIGKDFKLCRHRLEF